MKKKIDKKEFLRNLKRTWKLSNTNKKYLIIYIIVNIIISITSIITPILTARQLLYINKTNFNSLLKVTLLILIVEVVIGVLHYISHRTSSIFSERVKTNIQVELSKEVMKLTNEEIDKNTTGTFIERLNGECGDMSAFFQLLVDTATAVITSYGILFSIFIINKYIFVYFVICLLVLNYYSKYKHAKIMEVRKGLREVFESNTGLINEMIRGLKDIKLLNIENNFMDLMKNKFSYSNKKDYMLSGKTNLYFLLSNWIHSLIEFILILLLVILVTYKKLSIANFLVLYMYKSRVLSLFNRKSSFDGYAAEFNLACERVFEIIESNKFQKESFGEKKLSKINGDFEFKNVTFGYRENIEVLKDVCFNVKANTTVAFVGKSGSGKTTIFNLITKSYIPKEGTILIDNIDISKLDKDSIRNNMAVIKQDPYIFNMTIKENLMLVKPDLKNKEMYEACKSACLHDFIMSLPDKYDTVLGENGVKLSGGEKQRLSIARALLKNTEIILFDEATSSLDNETQENISQAIDNLKKDKTIMIIAHRLSTVINSDKIFVIDKGKIVGEGNHKELLKNNKIYQKLYNSELV